MSEYVGQQKEDPNSGNHAERLTDLLAAGLKIPKSTSLHSLLQGKNKGLDADVKFTKLTTFRWGPSTNLTKLSFLCYVNNKHTQSGAADFTTTAIL